LARVDVEDSLRLGLEHGIYAYDAYFLRCAKGFAAPLLTLDRRMKQVAGKLGLEVLEAGR
jgi:predicted nucleic acid-binding protein